MKAIKTKFIFWLISIVCFLGAFNLVEWLIDSDKYEFTVLRSVIAPLAAYTVASCVLWVLGKFSGKKKK